MLRTTNKRTQPAAVKSKIMDAKMIPDHGWHLHDFRMSCSLGIMYYGTEARNERCDNCNFMYVAESNGRVLAGPRSK